MYQSHPQALNILVADRMQKVRADLEWSRQRRRSRLRDPRRVKERRRGP
jgi:hypothetical protein